MPFFIKYPAGNCVKSHILFYFFKFFSCNDCKKGLTSLRERREQAYKEAVDKAKKELAEKSNTKMEVDTTEPKAETKTEEETKSELLERKTNVVGAEIKPELKPEGEVKTEPNENAAKIEEGELKTDLDTKMKTVFEDKTKNEVSKAKEVTETPAVEEENPPERKELGDVEGDKDGVTAKQQQAQETVKPEEEAKGKEPEVEVPEVSFQTQIAALFSPHGLDKCDECGHNSSVEYEQLVVSKDEITFVSSKVPSLKMMCLMHSNPAPTVTWENFTIGMAIDLKLTFSKWKRSMKFYEYWVLYQDLLKRNVLRCPSSGRFNVKVNGFEKILSLLMIRGKSYRNSDKVVQQKIKKILGSNFNLCEPHVRRNTKGLKSIVLSLIHI